MRHTSVETYNQIESEGLLSHMRMVVYKSIYKNGPLTISECTNIINSIDSKSISPRFAELERVGVITDVGLKICSITGRNVTLWQTTNKLPIKYKREKKIKCKHCKGKGYQLDAQTRML